MSQVQVVSMPGNLITFVTECQRTIAVSQLGDVWTHLWLSGYNLLSIWSLKNYTVVSKYGMVCRTLK